MYYLAIDIGASGGRHILGSLKNGKLVLEEIYRFPNSPVEKNGRLIWDIERLYNNVIEGLKECKKAGKIPYSVGIDTWGVDYALLNEKDELIGDVVCYRDERTKSSANAVHQIIPFSELYSKTGIQYAQFNTVYQLMEDKLSGKLDSAECFLTVPDYLHFLLCGVKVNEYTNASTTALVNAFTREWDSEIIEKLGYSKKIFQKIAQPDTILGELSASVQKEIGYNCSVVIPACHDTASAVMSVPAENGTPLYISSGTWSLLGTELKHPLTNEKALKFNMTNEGGYAHTYRFLKNISGMWAIQRIKKEFEDKYSFAEIADLAEKTEGFDFVVDINGERFLAPHSMIEEIRECCKENGEKIPQTVGELAKVVYNSLATLYAETINSLEEITQEKFTELNIVGGGSQNGYLNRLTKKAVGKKVFAGPVEGTAIGNIICQAISNKEISDIKQARKIVINSFDVKEV